jgi:hypothetical protein
MNATTAVPVVLVPAVELAGKSSSSILLLTPCVGETDMIAAPVAPDASAE